MVALHNLEHLLAGLLQLEVNLQDVICSSTCRMCEPAGGVLADTFGFKSKRHLSQPGSFPCSKGMHSACKIVPVHQNDANQALLREFFLQLPLPAEVVLCAGAKVDEP